MSHGPLRVMLVEDEMLIAMSLEDMIEDLGHEVVGRGAGIEDSLAVLKGLEEPPDAAVVDANLGGASALPVVEALVERGTYVVVASGYGRAELDRLGFDAPAIGKPYQEETLGRALSRCPRNGALRTTRSG